MAVEPEQPVQPRIQSVARATQVLEAIAGSRDGLTSAEISAAARLNRATTYHLLHTLAAVGWIVAGSGRRYSLAPGFAPLVEGFERHVLPQEFMPLARSLAAETGETTYIASRRGSQLMLVGSVPGSHPVGVFMSPAGVIREGHARASGKLLLAYAPDAVRDEYLDAHPLVRITDSTITDRRVLADQLAAIREQGFATDHGEYAPGVSCLAVPVAGGSLALVLSAPDERFDANREEYIAAALANRSAPITI
jgi:IclR family transcriptional regulator, acetate operon repressor